ncbi:MAG: HEPN domain-containing protein [Alphaproteobacteria bacterium]|nr:HEPN domain-containing protein [Alphaproteobacteria bacterium]
MTLYTERFRLVEEYLDHLDSVMVGIGDPFIQSRYLGFVTTAAVTVYELAIKDIFFSFSDKKHKILGSFSRGHFDRINGRIKIKDLKNEHVNMFGRKYVDKFEKMLEKKEKQFLKDGFGSIKSSYGNIITWRHTFVHEGVAPGTTNYPEIKNSYKLGKEIIFCLDHAMRR